MERRSCQGWLLCLCVSCLASMLRADDALWEAASDRIEKYRQADARITVTAAGRPVPGVSVEIRQQRHAFLFGCNIFSFGKLPDPAAEQAYRSQFAALFNYATIGFYWPSYERRQGQPNHEYAEQVARWCRTQGIVAKGHPLAWNYRDPDWLPAEVDTIRELQMARITDCVSRFRGLIDVWDVVNEATDFARAGNVEQSPKITRMWQQTGQVAFVNECFAAARRAHRDATLLINDYRTDARYAELIRQFAPLDGGRAYDVIGIQSHMHRNVWDNRQIWDVCERFAEFGVPLHFTELTVLSGQPGWERAGDWASTPSGEAQQAEEVGRIYTLLFSHPSVSAITWWDFADRNAWQGAPAGLLNQQLQPKPAYETLHRLIRTQWWTRTDRVTDQAGQAVFRGFLGDYAVHITAPDGRRVSVAVKVVPGPVNQFRIELMDR